MRKFGWTDSIADARLTWLAGSAYPAPPGALYIALYRGFPLSDGSDAASMELTRTASPVTFGSLQSLPGYEAPSSLPCVRFIQPTVGVTFTPPGPVVPGVSLTVGAWGIVGATGGPFYLNQWNAQLAQGVPITVPASGFRIFIEPQNT
jgi:hypothetical protein